MTTATKTETTLAVDAADLKAALALVAGSTKDPLTGGNSVLVAVEEDELVLTGSTFATLAKTSIAAKEKR